MADPVYTSPLIDKLGVKPGARVAVINIDDNEFRNVAALERAEDLRGGPAPDTPLDQRVG